MTQAKAEKVIDGRNMEPPEPFVQTMDALDLIEPGQKVLLILGREPLSLIHISRSSKRKASS